MLAAQYALWSVGVYGFVFWLPTIVKSLPGERDRLDRGADGDAVCGRGHAMIAVSAVSDRLAHRRVFTWVPLLIAAVVRVSYLTRGGTSPPRSSC